MATYENPITPQTTRPERPRTVSMMSGGSTARSHKTTRSKEEKKLDLTESPKDKRRLEGYSDPTKALAVPEPSIVALQESNIENIREGQYKDKEGNLIRDPDRSNPTRPRLERPLDTIRAFNAAAEGTTSRRSSYQRPQSQYGGWEGQQQRPSSYYGGQPRSGPRPGPPNGGYYSNSYQRPQPQQFYRGDSFPEEGEQRPMDYGRPVQRASNAPYVDQYDHAQPGSMRRNQYSYDTMTSGSDEMSKSTNPSSENSSFDQIHQAGRKHEGDHPTNPYRQQGFRNGPPPSAFNNQNNNYGGRVQPPTDDYGFEVGAGAPPPPPKHAQQAPDSRNAGRLQKTTSNSRPEPAKRQSWIKRTFSKRSWD